MDKVSFRCNDGIHVLHAEYGGGTEDTYPKGLINAKREEVYAEEEFTPRPGEDGRWGFQSATGAWLSAQPDGTLIANRIRPDDFVPTAWEAFVVERKPNGAIALLSDHGRYVCAEGAGGGDVHVDRLAANAWEQLTPSYPFYQQGPNPVPPDAILRVRVEGKFWVTDHGPFRPRFCSMLSILRRGDAETRDLLDWVATTGFNGIRVFAGNLTWAGQTAAQAVARLPFLLAECAQRALYVEITALTDTAMNPSYDPFPHVQRIGALCERVDHTLLEIANEYWHPTQSAQVHDINNLVTLRRSVPSWLVCALGAPTTDEVPLPPPHAEYLTLHLDRGRDKWNQVRRVKELWEAAGTVGKPVMNNEPTGADERDGSQTGKQRINDPSFFFCMGALTRLFEVGGVHHSQHGLDAVLPGPVQQQCAEAYLTGWRAIRTDARVGFYNAGWPESPVKAANFNNVVRTYSGVWGSEGALVLVGLMGDPQLEMGAGWRLGPVIAEMSGCRIHQLAR